MTSIHGTTLENYWLQNSCLRLLHCAPQSSLPDSTAMDLREAELEIPRTHPWKQTNHSCGCTSRRPPCLCIDPFHCNIFAMKFGHIRDLPALHSLCLFFSPARQDRKPGAESFTWQCGCQIPGQYARNPLDSSFYFHIWVYWHLLGQFTPCWPETTQCRACRQTSHAISTTSRSRLFYKFKVSHDLHYASPSLDMSRE